LMQWKWIKWR